MQKTQTLTHEFCTVKFSTLPVVVPSVIPRKRPFHFLSIVGQKYKPKDVFSLKYVAFPSFSKTHRCRNRCC